MLATTADLTLPGRILLWTARHWLRARRQRRDLPGFVLHTIEQLPDGTTLRDRTEALLAHLELGSARPFAVAAPDAGRLTADEHRLCLALHACSVQLKDEARRLLAEQQTARGLRATTTALVSVEACLGRQRLTIANGLHDGDPLAALRAPAQGASEAPTANTPKPAGTH